jgi:hypothetical protein
MLSQESHRLRCALSSNFVPGSIGCVGETHRRGNHGDELSGMKVMGSRGYDDLFVGRQRADLRTKQGGLAYSGRHSRLWLQNTHHLSVLQPHSAYHRRTVAGNSCSSPCVLDVLMAESLPPDLGHVCVSGVHSPKHSLCGWGGALPKSLTRSPHRVQDRGVWNGPLSCRVCVCRAALAQDCR